MKPIIGITCNYCVEDIGSALKIGVPGQEWQALANDYIRAVSEAGGVPFIIPIMEQEEDVCALLNLCDGILISGGNDISPLCYHESVSGKIGSVVASRDRQELHMCKYMMNHMQIPILGICRGAQMLNIAGGGNLYQDLEQEGFDHVAWGVPLDSFAHTVELASDTRLGHMIGEERMWINSYHHQAVRQIAPDFRVCATAPDGIAEALELPGDRFVLGVQWHPEMLPGCEKNRKIFSEFISACE